MSRAIKVVNPSIEYLKRRCKAVFSPTRPFFFDFKSWPQLKTVDFVLIGLAPSIVLLKWIWPSNMKYRLWVLCRAHRRILVDLMGFPEGSIGLVPRYRLAPNPKKMIQRYLDLNQEFDLVYSARTLSHKNFALTCAVAAEFQRVSQKRVRFLICGSRLDRDRPKVEKELKRHLWKTKPQILGDLGTRWFKRSWTNPTLINLSTFCYEDFGVSVAQAEQQGWPMILSAWGAHLDVRSEGAVLVPAKLILRNHSLSSQRRAAKLIVSDLLSRPTQRTPEVFKEQERWVRPQALDRKQIEKILSRLNPGMRKAIETYFDLSVEHRSKEKNRWNQKVEEALSREF